jgi:hypothetical protein
VVIGLSVDVPRDGPDLGGNVLQQSGLTHLFLKERAVDGGERFDRDKEVDSGGAPGSAVLGEATTRDAIVDIGVILQWSAPSVQAPGEPREGCPDEALVCGQPLEGRLPTPETGPGTRSVDASG